MLCSHLLQVDFACKGCFVSCKHVCWGVGPSRSSVDERHRDRDRLVPKAVALTTGAAGAQVRQLSCKCRGS
jgi:hypothetical protein